ncbi:putative L-ascorbate peroxidase 6 [Musa acuminata AAA Group]|uniref:putative L-ascorbate peroxidase 6 n=1 Tax=Musa acuminata AAA Group TaxID=214697 RepID=UPI0031E314DE
MAMLQQPLHLSALLSVRPRCTSSSSRRRTNPKLFPAFRCRIMEAKQVDARSNERDPLSHMEKIVASSRRRRLILTLLIPIMFPQHHIAKAVDVGEASILQNGVRNLMSKAKAAGLLRLAFHDAGTFDLDDKSGGMNGSIVYELDRPENAGLNKSLKVLEKAKMEIEKNQQVSWADLIAVAGAEAVSFCGGPVIPVQLGRLDARTPDPQGKLPQETLDASGLKKCFLKKGFSTQELVALSGAHTIGNKGFGSPVVFDNAYFNILLEKTWTSSGGMLSMIGLPSDRALAEDEECLRWIKIYAGDQAKFFDDFRNAYIKLVNSGASWRIV